MSPSLQAIALAPLSSHPGSCRLVRAISCLGQRSGLPVCRPALPPPPSPHSSQSDPAGVLGEIMSHTHTHPHPALPAPHPPSVPISEEEPKSPEVRNPIQQVLTAPPLSLTGLGQRRPPGCCSDTPGLQPAPGFRLLEPVPERCVMCSGSSWKCHLHGDTSPTPLTVTPQQSLCPLPTPLQITAL